MNAETLAGLVLAAISLALTALARLQLGKSFSVTPKANDLGVRVLDEKGLVSILAGDR